MHLVDPGDVFLLVVHGIEHSAALSELARVDTDVGQVAVGVVDHLEYEGGERITLAVGSNNLDVRITRVRAFDGRHLSGIREVFDDAVE